MQEQYANIYESATQPLRYTDNTLAQRGDVVLYLHEEHGRVKEARMMRVWDSVYYQDGEPIGVILVDAASPKNTLPELHTFTVTDRWGDPHLYFRGKITVPQHKIPYQLFPLFRMGFYMKQWNDETQRVSVVPQPPNEPYPEPDEIYEEFFQKTVLKHAMQRNPYCLFTAGLWQRQKHYPHRALEFYRAAATLNFPAAWLELGLAYEGSDLLQRNPEKSAACFQQASSLQNPLAYYHLALCYINGKGVVQSDTFAVEYLQSAVEAGILPAFYTLAIYYRTGTFNKWRPKNSPYRALEPVEPKHRAAFKLLKRAAEEKWEHTAECKFHLGECYRLGEGVRPDLPTAHELYKDVILTGSQLADEVLEACYYTGNVLQLALSAEAGSAYAAYLLGRMRLYGEQGVEKNKIAGLRYLRIASESPYEFADMAGRMLQQKEDVTWTFNQL